MLRIVFLCAGVIAFASAAQSATTTASPCKGLDQTACTANANCSWIKSYTTKKGHTVNAFCRKKTAGFKKKS